MDRVSLRSIRATLALMVMRSIYQGKCRSVTWVERRETFGAALAWPARTMAKRSRGAPAPEFLFTNATICLPETKAERRKRHVARMSVSEIRGGHSSFQLVPGFHGACHRAGHFGPDPLVHPGYKFIRLPGYKEGRRNADRRVSPTSAPPPSSSPLRGGQRRGRGARPSERARLSAFHRATCLGEPTPTAQLRLRASWDVALTGVTHLQPVPVQRVPRRPVIMPAGRIPEAARGLISSAYFYQLTFYINVLLRETLSRHIVGKYIGSTPYSFGKIQSTFLKRNTTNLWRTIGNC
jgi:hypothetical protein